MVEVKQNWVKHGMVLGVIVSLILGLYAIDETDAFAIVSVDSFGFPFFTFCGSLLVLANLCLERVQFVLKWQHMLLWLFLVFSLKSQYGFIDADIDLCFFCMLSMGFIYALYQDGLDHGTEIMLLFLMSAGMFIFSRLLFLSGPYLPLVRDEFLLAMEGALGGYPSLMMGRVYASLPGILKLVIDFTYMSLPFMLFVVYQNRKTQDPQMPFDLLAEFVTIGLVGGALYTLVPGCGSAGAFSPGWPFTLPATFLSQGPQWMSCAEQFPRNCVPSLHVAWFICLLRGTYQCDRYIRSFIMLFGVITMVAVFGPGAHYLVDVMMGLCFANVMGGIFMWRLPFQSVRFQTVICGVVMMLGWYVLIFDGLPLLQASRSLTSLIFISSGIMSLFLEYRLNVALNTKERSMARPMDDACRMV